MQILFNLLAVAAILLAIKPIRNSNRIIVAILAFLWLWMGIVYHLMFFTGINKAAYVFGAAYVVQGGLFVFAGLIRSDLSFRHRLNAVTIFGDLLVLYALIIYPFRATSLVMLIRNLRHSVFRVRRQSSRLEFCCGLMSTYRDTSW